LQQFNGGDPYLFAKRQSIFVAVGILAMVVAAAVDYRLIREFATPVYLATLVVLVIVLFVGKEVSGARAWFQLPGGVQLQPAEFGKLVAITALAAFAANHGGSLKLNGLLNSLALIGVPMVLVFLQGDLGTMLVYVAVTMGMLFIAGARVRHIVLMTLAGLLAIVLAFNVDNLLGVELIGPRQEERLTAFLDQDADLNSANYNLQQSQIALGSGGLTGRGYLQGIQTNLNLVPEQQTDFIFTAAGEELGFLFGSLPLLITYLVLMWRILRAAQLSSDRFGVLLCVGVMSMMMFQVFQNLGMTMGIMPITGIPLPFMSHGGSSIITAFIAVGLVINVRSRRYAG
jgi:rod shape determining protein RodA